jgi:hypothetical protein
MTTGCCCMDGIAEYNLANDSSPSHLGAAQVTRVQPKSTRVQPNFSLAPSRCAIALCNRYHYCHCRAANVARFHCPLPLCHCHCHCCPAAVAAAAATQCPLLCRRHHCCCSILSAAAAVAAQATKAQPARDCKGAAQATRAQPKSQKRSPSLRGSIPSHAQLPFDCCVYSSEMPLFAVQCMKCRRLFGGTSHINTIIIKWRNV